jgi:hypothetical protein
LSQRKTFSMRSRLGASQPDSRSSPMVHVDGQSRTGALEAAAQVFSLAPPPLRMLP